MGLDSVERLMQLEKKFKVNIPDQDAENICTVGDMIDWFFNKLKLRQPDKKTEDMIFVLIRDVFDKLNLPNDFKPENTLKDYIPEGDLKAFWQRFQTELNLKIPELNPRDFTHKELKAVKILGISISNPKPPILAMTFSRFVELIGALNYVKFVDFDNLTSLFEIKIAVIGITHQKGGVDINEIFIESSFSEDLGID